MTCVFWCKKPLSWRIWNIILFRSLTNSHFTKTKTFFGRELWIGDGLTNKMRVQITPQNKQQQTAGGGGGSNENDIMLEGRAVSVPVLLWGQNSLVEQTLSLQAVTFHPSMTVFQLCCFFSVSFLCQINSDSHLYGGDIKQTPRECFSCFCSTLSHVIQCPIWNKASPLTVWRRCRGLHNCTTDDIICTPVHTKRPWSSNIAHTATATMFTNGLCPNEERCSR